MEYTMPVKKVAVIIKRDADGTYGACLDISEKTGFDLLGEGSSVEETIADFLQGHVEMQQAYAEVGVPFPDLEFEYKYDMASFLNHYSKIMSLAGLERLTGINQKQLSHYSNGYKIPRADTILKIEKSLHDLAVELSKVRFQ
jgi:hypothetical protein